MKSPSCFLLHTAQKHTVPVVLRSRIAGPLTAAGDGPGIRDTSPAPRHRSGSVFYGFIHLVLCRIAIEFGNLRREICNFAGQEEFPDDVRRNGGTEFF